MVRVDASTGLISESIEAVLEANPLKQCWQRSKGRPRLIGRQHVAARVEESKAGKRLCVGSNRGRYCLQEALHSCFRPKN